MYSDFIYNETVEFLSFEDQRHFVFLLCMKNEGMLDKHYPQPGMLERVVGRRLGLVGEALDNAKRRISEVGLIDENWQPINWNNRQFISDADPSHAARQRRYREKQKEKTRDVTRDVTVTVLDTDTDTDTDTDPEKTIGTVVPSISKSEKKKEKPTTVPKDFEVTAEMFDWAESQGLSASRIKPETEQFLDRNKAKGDTYLDWTAAWRTWIRNAVKFARAA
jgi:hypothetical protein